MLCCYCTVFILRGYTVHFDLVTSRCSADVITAFAARQLELKFREQISCLRPQLCVPHPSCVSPPAQAWTVPHSPLRPRPASLALQPGHIQQSVIAQTPASLHRTLFVYFRLCDVIRADVSVCDVTCAFGEFIVFVYVFTGG